jgi:NAD+ kinase
LRIPVAPRSNRFFVAAEVRLTNKVAGVTYRRVALVVHPTRRIGGALAALNGWAGERGVAVVQVANRGETRQRIAAAAEVESDDLVVALGGDGTMLSALRMASPAGVPVLGVACGSLGALSAVTGDEVAGALERVFTGDWTPRSLPALAITADGETSERALNDFVIVRGGAGHIAAAVSVDDELYARLSGDGVIIATALGSSAYSMAGGGPLLASGTPAFVCTPLAMHGGSAPSLVVPADAALTVDVTPGHSGFAVEIDGFRTTPTTRRFQITLEPDVATLVGFDRGGRGLAPLRARRLITDSPRIMARDDRAPGRAG